MENNEVHFENLGLGSGITDRALASREVVNTAISKTASEISNAEQATMDRDAERFEIRPVIESLEVGDEVELRAMAIPTPTQKLPNDPCVVWESSNESVAFFTGGNV